MTWFTILHPKLSYIQPDIDVDEYNSRYYCLFNFSEEQVEALSFIVL